MNTDARLTAKLLSACPPDSAQKEKLEDVLSKKYGKAVELVWQEDRTAQGGFRIELGSEVIDWTSVLLSAPPAVARGAAGAAERALDAVFPLLGLAIARATSPTPTVVRRYTAL